MNTPNLLFHNIFRFFDILDESSRNTYFFLVGTNIIATSVSAVQVEINLKNQKEIRKDLIMNIFTFQIVLNLDKLEVAIKSAVFLIAAQFHLFILSIPGQILLNHYSNLKNNMYVLHAVI